MVNKICFPVLLYGMESWTLTEPGSMQNVVVPAHIKNTLERSNYKKYNYSHKNGKRKRAACSDKNVRAGIPGTYHGKQSAKQLVLDQERTRKKKPKNMV